MRSLKTNAILNMVCRGSSILFPMLTFTYASRTLGADKLGIYSFCNSVIAYFLLFAALGISTYAVREGQAVRDNPEQLRRFISEVYTINFIMTLASYALLGLLLLVWGKLNAYREIVLVLSVSMILTTIGADWVNTLLEDYLFITLRYIAVQIVCLGALVALVKSPDDLYRYALIGALSSAGGNLLNIWHIRRRIPFHLTRRPNLRRHIGPMLTLFSNSLAIKLYLASDIVILGILMETRFVGYYTASSNVYSALKGIMNALVLVTVPRFAFYVSHNMRKEYLASFSMVLDGVITLTLPCAAGLYMEAENILYFLGGAEYVAGTGALKILSLALPFAVGACLFSNSVLIPYKQERFFLKATAISATVNIVLNFPLIPVWGIQAAALTTLLSECIVFGMTLYKSKAYLTKWSNVSSAFVSSAFGAASVILMCAAANRLIADRLPGLIASVTGSAAAYAAVTYALGNQTVSGIANHARTIIRRRVFGME